MLDAATARRCGPDGLSAALEGGVDWLQLRDRGVEAAGLLEAVDRACAAARGAPGPARVLVNRRLDVARAAGADGVHLGFDGLPAALARAQLDPEAPVGVSTHAPGEVARESDASYVQLAPVFPPLSKRSDRPPLGLAALAEACRHGLPVLAQGGIDASNAAAAIGAGAAGVAVTGAIDPDHPGRTARVLRGALDA